MSVASLELGFAISWPAVKAGRVGTALATSKKTVSFRSRPYFRAVVKRISPYSYTPCVPFFAHIALSSLDILEPAFLVRGPLVPPPPPLQELPQFAKLS